MQSRRDWSERAEGCEAKMGGLTSGAECSEEGFAGLKLFHENKSINHLTCCAVGVARDERIRCGIPSPKCYRMEFHGSQRNVRYRNGGEFHRGRHVDR